MFKPCLIDQLAFNEPTAEFESKNLEYELEVYLKGFDVEQIKSMAVSHEGQEQWGIYVPKTPKNASDGSLRVRKTIHPDDRVEYEFCTKTNAGDKGKVEVPDPSREEQLEQFKLMADQGLIKTRFIIPGSFENGIEFKWEVDLFLNKEGKIVPWAKVDIELNPDDPRPDVKNFPVPFTHDEVIIISPEMKADGTGPKEKIAELYEKYFRTENVYV
jgi:hypothetical protein